jgi:uncharacterized MAPEG superfamily protein
MSIDLWMLVWSAVLCMVMPYPGVTVVLQMPGGPAWGFGNRDATFEVPAWIGRLRRAHANMVENLAPFACLVLVAHLAGKANGWTALGAEIFFVSRVLYTLVYVAGIAGLRTAVFTVSVTAEFLILLQILR